MLDVYLLERNLMLRVPNESEAIRGLVARLARYRLARIVIEATGPSSKYARRIGNRPKPPPYPEADGSRSDLHETEQCPCSFRRCSRGASA